MLVPQSRDREALRRMMQIPRGTLEVRSESVGAVSLPVHEYDQATGVNGEVVTARMLALATRGS